MPATLGNTVAGPGPGLLTSAKAGVILRAALQDAGGELVSWRADQVDHQPTGASTASYRARVRLPDGVITEERLGLYTGAPPEGTLVLENGPDRVAVWRFPHDPYLPGLATAYDARAVAGLLGNLGLGGGPVRLVLRAYRPRKRAVVEAVGDNGRLFLKVVPPHRVEPLHQRHRLLTGAEMPVAPSLGYTPEGVVVLQALPGVTLRDALREGSAPLPGGADVVRLLDRLPPQLTEAPRRRSWLQRAGHYARVVASCLPGEAQRVEQLGAALATEAGTGPTVPVHGDFYESQLRVRDGRITGLLDVDTAGPGERLDDLACLLGHLSVLTQVSPDRAGVINRLGARCLAAFGDVVDPVDLRYRIAAVALSLATGPHRVQQQGWRAATRTRLDLAEQWIDNARWLAGRSA